MHIPNLQVSMAMYEARELIKKCEKNGDGLRLKAVNNTAQRSARINNQEMRPNSPKANEHVRYIFGSNDHIKPNEQIGARVQNSSTRVLDVKAYNIQFRREQIKKIFRCHDSDNDGFLNISDLTKAFAFLGSTEPFYKAYYGLVHADANKDGLISEAELDKLIDYADKIIKEKKRF